MKSRVIYRPMQLSDIYWIVEIDKHSHPKDAWPASAFRNELTNNALARYIVVEVDGNIAGYCGCWLTSNNAHITSISVHPDYRLRGLAKGLLCNILALADAAGNKSMVLEVAVSNKNAQKLYRKLGFIPIGVRKGYYVSTGDDAIVMQLDWSEPQDHLCKRIMHTGYRN